MMITILFRTAILYSTLLLTVRLLGKRQLGEMEPSEFVVSMLLANLATIPMEEPDTPIFHGIVPIILIFLAETAIAYLSLRSVWIRKFFCGKPVILIENGKISAENLRRTKVNLDELTMHLREKDVFDLSTVKFAILETNGQLSILLNGKDQPPTAKDLLIKVPDTQLPITLITDGCILKDNLSLAGKDLLWLRKELKKRNCPLKQALLLTIDGAGKIYFLRRSDCP
ncbi:MAG: DUF421 domain-containing protein [Oscillospiraceae bacterium]|nr:DUF421 domain-containing protein [Oscillospiraceae bacterium]